MTVVDNYLVRTNIHPLTALRVVGGVPLLVSLFALCLVGVITESPASAALRPSLRVADNASICGIGPTNVSYASANQQGIYSPEKLSMSLVETTAGSTQYTYDLDQQLTQLIQPGGVTVTFGYDGAGRPSAVTHPSGSVNISYAPLTGDLSQLVTADSITLTYGYDGPLITGTTWSGVISGTVQRTFDNDLRISSEAINGTSSVSYGYDQDGLLTQAGALSATRSAQNGLLTGTTLGSVTDTLGYNQFAEVLTYTAAYNGATMLRHADTRDNGGRIAQRIETVSGITHTYVYTYDAAYRLADIGRDGAQLSHYSYSPNGNRTGYIGVNGVITGTYDAQDRLLQYGNLAFTYKPNGELQSKIDVSTSQTTTYVYDALGNLRAVTLPDGTQISYVVDGQNRRVGKKVDGTLVQGFLYGDALEPVAELDAAGNVVSRFVYGMQVNTPSYMVKAGQTYFIVSDHLGSPRLAVNVSNGQIAQRMDYDEFGNVLTDTNPGFQPFGFAGGIYDLDTKLVRFGARDYDPFTGRWTSKDPLLFRGGSANLYAYTANDPVNSIDPSGLDYYRHGQYKTADEAAAAALFSANYERNSNILSSGDTCHYMGCVGRNYDGTYYYSVPERDTSSSQVAARQCGGYPEMIYSTEYGPIDLRSESPNRNTTEINTIPSDFLKSYGPNQYPNEKKDHEPMIMFPGRIAILMGLLLPAIQK
jgi:RHS repeat-associated protein